MKKQIAILSAFILLTAFSAAAVGVGDLRCENLRNPLAVDTPAPRFSWKLDGTKEGEGQKAYRIEVASEPSLLEKGTPDLWDSGKVVSNESVLVPYGGKPLGSRSLCYWRVKVWGDRGGASRWSETARFGVGLIDPSQIEGTFIGYPSSGGTAVLLRGKFNATQASAPAMLHVNSLGYHEVYLNGERVGDDVLAPAISQMNKRPLYVTYDVTQLLRGGANELVVWLGQGWHKKGTFGRWERDEPYAEPLVRAQLDRLSADGWETLCATDATWQTAKTGYTDTGSWNALDFGGERVDARLNPSDMSSKSLDALEWRGVMTAEKPQYTATPQMCEPNRIRETLEPLAVRRTDDGRWFVDFGKVLTGWFEMELSGMPAGTEITIEYSDEVDKDGNILDQRQADSYITRGGDERFINKFNHHAFRYAVVSGLPDEPAKEELKGHRIYTDYSAASSFECSDPDLNAIHDMVNYTVQCLAYSGYMVDCPHLERAGYGGDGNSSLETFQTMYDAAPLFANWIQSWSDAMRPGGSLPHVAPNAGAGGGGPYWCGFMVMAPWQTYLNYGDSRFIERYYPAMQEWLSYVDSYTVDGLLTRWPDTEYRDWYLGDWLAPAGVDSGNPESVSLVNNCFISDCFAKMERMATLLGREGDAAMYAAKRTELNRLLHQTYFNPDDCTYATGSQLDMTYPMLVGVTPPELYGDVRARLFELTESRQGGHIGGGLFGVPVITRWAVADGAADYICTMLKKRDYPGYLYMIDNGATATWEYWNGERSRVHNCYNGIGMWFYRAVGGLRPDENAPGYRHFTIDPQIPGGVTWCKVTKETPYGTVRLDWELSGGELAIRVELPAGTSATVVAPAGATACRLDGGKHPAADFEIASGPHEIVFSLHN